MEAGSAAPLSAGSGLVFRAGTGPVRGAKLIVPLAAVSITTLPSLAARLVEMSLLQFMHDVPLWLVAFIIGAAAELYAIGLMLLCRATFGVDRLSVNNEVAGFKFAVVGVLYAVLLAFVVIAVWEEFRDTESAVRNEAKAAVDLHRVTHALPVDGRDAIHKDLLTYLEDVRKYEWPSMALGKSSDIVAKDLDALSQTIFSVQPQDQRESALYAHALRLLTGMTDNREERLDSANGSVPRIMWLVLIVGGLLTLGYPAFFGSSNVAAQVLMTGALAALVALSLLLGLALDYPFTGGVRISSAPFDEALQQMPKDWPPP